MAARGYADESFVKTYRGINDIGLIQLLNSPDPCERSACAWVLGKRKIKAAIEPLCLLLEKEKKLYTKIAVCDALTAVGEPAVAHLICRLGRVGNNQHRHLPQKPFQKKNYPLPRDIAARTLAKIGPSALPHLEDVVVGNDRVKISEAIDAIGCIAWKSKVTSSLNPLKECLLRHKADSVIHWKIIRAFQSFPEDSVIYYLRSVAAKSDRKQLIWEAHRSLTQILSRKT